MSKTIYITDGDALNIDRVVVSTGDLKGCKVFYSCDLIDEYKARLQAEKVAMLKDLKQDIIAEAYGIEMDCTDYVVNVADIDKVIYQKINSLKEQTR